MVLAFVLLASGSVTLLLHAHYSARKAWDRPAWVRGGRGLRVVRGAGWALVLGGALLLVGRSWPAGLVTASLVAATLAWTRWVRSPAYLALGLRREVERLRRAHPDRSEQDLLRDVVLARHPRWGEDLASQIVSEQGSVRRVAEMLVRMERS